MDRSEWTRHKTGHPGPSEPGLRTQHKESKRGVHGTAAAIARATRSVLAQNLASHVDHHGAVVLLQFRRTPLCGPVERDQIHRLPARLLHGRTRIADRI